MTGIVKICGLSTPDTLDAAIAAGADMVGLVRFPRSPRHVQLGLGRDLSFAARGRATRVLLLVDPTDADLDEALPAIEPDLLQLHGRETPERVAEMRRRAGVPVMKAIGIGGMADLARIDAYRNSADRVLLDAKPSPDSTRPGGNGLSFDWSLLRGLDVDAPASSSMLSGGLDPDNVVRAVGLTGMRAVDVSSGVESRPGEKDSAKIEAFVRAARAAFAASQPAAPYAHDRRIA